MKMRVCMISSVDMNAPYGSTTRPYYISKNLAEFGCEILHVCAKPPEIEEVGIRYSPKKYHKNKLWVIRTCRDIFRIYRECKSFAPDVLYVHQISNATRALPLKYLLKKPLVYDEHGAYLLDINPRRKDLLWEQTVLKMADKVIVVTNDVKEVFTKIYRVPEEKIATIGNGVNTNLFKPMERDKKLKDKLGIYGNKVVVFTCPRGSPANNLALEYFFNLVPKIENKIKNIKFIIIGGGSQINPPSKSVIYTGFVRDIVSYINLADVCIAPYPSSAVCGTSGAKNKVIEYFACGKPVVSTREGIRGFDDAVPNRDFLLAVDSDDFVNKLITVLNNENLSIKLSENARKFSLKYDWRNLSKEVLHVLKQVVRHNGEKL